MSYFQEGTRRIWQIQIRAVDSDNGLEEGIARIGVDVKPTTNGRLKGMCIPFSVDEKDHVTLYADSGFFMGLK